MKRHIAFLLGILIFPVCHPANAYCRGHHFNVWPKGDTLSTEPVIILSGYYSLLSNLHTRYPVYLCSRHGKVALRTEQLVSGYLGYGQVLLKPEKPLVAGDTYALSILGLNEYDSADFYDDPHNWYVIVHKQPSDPLPWLKTPVFRSKTFMLFGCGPEAYVNFCACLYNITSQIVQVRLIRPGQDTFLYFTECYFGNIQVGYGMCGGALEFDTGSTYQVSFRIMDQAGLFSAYTNPFTFTPPNISDIPPHDTTNTERIIIAAGCTDCLNRGMNHFWRLMLLYSTLFLILLIWLPFMARKPKHG